VADAVTKATANAGAATTTAAATVARVPASVATAAQPAQDAVGSLLGQP
jgi:hypothetical protein